MNKHLFNGSISLSLITEPIWSHPLEAISQVFHFLSPVIGTIVGVITLWRMLENKDKK